MHIRPVAPSEYQAAGRLVVAAYEALPGAHMSEGYAALLADVARRAAEADVLVAAAAGQETEVAGQETTAAGQGTEVAGQAAGLLGCVTFVPSPASPWAEQLQPDEAGVRMLAVRPAAQGRGVGAALLAACVERAHQLGKSALFLHSTPWMLSAHHIYEKAGFARVPERDWFPVPEVPLLAFFLELPSSTAGGASSPS
ncbi:MAG: GNAT family N-acetyltransferase [Acidimicrobiales bacterium]